MGESTFKTCALGLTFALATTPAVAGHLPTYGGVVHLDPHAPGVFAILAPGAGLLFPGGDDLNAPTQPWHWEFEFDNPLAFQITIPIQAAVGGAGGVVLLEGNLTLPPLTSAAFDVHLPENALIFGGPDVGRFLALGSVGGNPAGLGFVGFDVSVTEDPEDLDDIPPGFEDGLVGEDVYLVELVPEPTTLSLLAPSGLLLLRRRR